MAGFVPNVWRATLLDVNSGRATVNSSSLYLGLIISIPDDPYTATLDTIIEPTTAGYVRVAIPTFDAATTVAPIQSVVSSDFQFGALTEDMVDPVNYAFMTNALAGTSGQLRYIWELATPILGKAGQPIIIPANTLILE